MLPVGFEPTISVGERPQTYALDRAATGSGNKSYYQLIIYMVVDIIAYITLRPKITKFQPFDVN